MMNMNQLMNQAKAMQKKIADMQDQLATQEFEGTSGGDLVKIVISGKGNINSLKISPELIDKEEIEALEDLIIAAFNKAKQKLDEASEGNMAGVMPAGFKFPF